MNKDYIEISRELLDLSFGKFSPKNWIIFFKFLRLLLKYSGEISMSILEIQCELNVSRRDILKIIRILKEENIIYEKTKRIGEKWFRNDSIFCLNEKYINKENS